MPVPRLLDVSKLPFEAKYKCKNGTIVDIEEILGGLRMPIDILGSTGNTDQINSLGFAMAPPLTGSSYELSGCWNDPAKFVWYVGGWGPDLFMLIANAVRKMRALIREQTDTLLIRHEDLRTFMDVVPQVDEDGNFPWGDFPWGGAVSLYLGGMFFEGAVSTYPDDIDDDRVANLILGTIAKPILRGNGLLPLD